MTSRAIQPLIKANVAILSQKIALLDSLVAKYGSKEASSAFQKICPIVGASIGQHYRHSMDHLELAALLASHPPERVSDINPKQFLELSAKPSLHYDLRVRGGTLEKDLVESRKRIVNVVDVFENMQSTKKADDFTSISVTAFFNLTADSNDEIGLPSTIRRELGFVAHHAIHHMALVKIIAMHTLGFKENDLPVGFGRAPSTILFDKQQ